MEHLARPYAGIPHVRMEKGLTPGKMILETEPTQWGVTFGFYAANGYFSSSAAKDEIEAIARSGATWVTVVPTVWQDTGSSTFQYKDFALRQLVTRHGVACVGPRWQAGQIFVTIRGDFVYD